jgi:hypothetical protein
VNRHADEARGDEAIPEDALRDGSLRDEPERDADLAAALAAALPRPAPEAVDWDGLHARVMAGARPVLQARRGLPPGAAERGWLDALAGWSRPGVPAGGLAVLALILLLVLLPARPGHPPGAAGDGGAAPVAAERITMQDELMRGVADDLRPLVLAGGDADILLDLALGFAGEEW